MPSNEYYESSGVPASKSKLDSSAIRAEFLKVQNIGDLLPVMSGNNNYFCCINSGGTGQVSLSPSAAAEKMGSELVSTRDAESSHPGMTLFKINFMDAAGEFKSFFTNENTESRTYSFQDKSGIIALSEDVDDIDARVTASNLVISANTSNIAANVSDIASHDTRILANTSDIAANTSDIAANTSDIAANASDIDTLQSEMLVQQSSDMTGVSYTDPDAVGANPVATLYPDGSICGSTDNGRYTKLSNGDMVCSGDFTTQGSLKTVTLPHEFIVQPKISAASTQSTTTTVFNIKLSSIGISSFNVVATNGSTLSTINCNYIAIGRWKE